MALPEIVDDAPKADRSTEAVALAKGYRSRAESLEPKLTAMLSGLAQKLGGKMEGLGFRLKSTDSIARKIDKEVLEDKSLNGSKEAAAANMGDIIRHTVSFGETDYEGGMSNMVEALKADGYVVKVKNFWKDGDPYQGVNINLTKDGVKTELQFHTPESLSTKEKNHVDYETYRLPTTPKSVRAELFRKMTEAANRIPKPKDYEKLLAFGTLMLQTLE